MFDVNKVLISGRLTKDPEHSETDGGTACNFCVASNKTHRPKDGPPKDIPTFCYVTAWNKLADVVRDHARAGKPILVEGELRNDNWTAADGAKRSRLYVMATRVEFAHN